MTMKKIVIALFLVLMTSGNSFAKTFSGFSGGNDITLLRVHSNGFVEFGVEQLMFGTCDYFGYQFRFDGNTEGGRNMFSLLLAAKNAGRKLDIWYSNSSQGGKDETNGCTLDVLSSPNSIALR